MFADVRMRGDTGTCACLLPTPISVVVPYRHKIRKGLLVGILSGTQGFTVSTSILLLNVQHACSTDCPFAPTKLQQRKIPRPADRNSLSDSNISELLIR